MRTRKALAMLLYYARTFAPWIVLAVVSGWSDQIGATAGLVTAVLLLAQDLFRRRPPDSMILEISSAIFMALLTALAFADPRAGLLNYGASLAIGWLAVTAWLTVAVGRPFTAGVGRQNVSAEIAATDLFRRIVRTIAVVWAVSFTVMAVILAVVQHGAPDATILLVAVKVCGFAIPAVFTARYPAHVAGRETATGTTASP